MAKIDILMVQKRYSERDSMVMYNIHYFLEKMGFRTKIEWALNPYYLDIYKPKVLFLIDAHGDHAYINIAKYAKEKGIITVALSSEANYPGSMIDQNFWGWAKATKKHYIDQRFVWNQYIKDHILEMFPNYSGELEVSGAVGFDRYIYMKLMSKPEFFAKYNKHKYKHIITFIGYVFDYAVLLRDGKCENYRHTSKEQNEQRLKDFYFIRECLVKICKNNPDVLFILKKHPFQYLDESEFDSSLKNMDNVIFIADEEGISDLLNVSDMCVAYDSTSFMEGWILEKMCVQLMLECNYDEHHTKLFGGNVIASTTEDFQKNIDIMKKGEKNTEYESKRKFREEHLKKWLMALDGLNGYRTALKISEFLKRKHYENVKPKFSPLWFKYFLYNQIFKVILNINLGIHKFNELRKTYSSMPLIYKRMNFYESQIDNFIKKKGIKIEK